MSALVKATLLGLLVAAVTAGTAVAAPQPGTAARDRVIARAPLDTIPDSTVSVNWAGFWVTGFRRTKASKGPFTRVSATWVQPEATCAALKPTYSALWVGIGGVTVNSRALEQIGSAADCGFDAQARHYFWYEIWPAPPLGVTADVEPGDVVAASVTIVRKKVTFRIANVTRGTNFARAVKMKAPDRSSAEWIAEAPADCNAVGICRGNELTNFGTVAFSNATATSKGHVGPISDAVWHTTHADLQPSAPSDGFVIPAVGSGSAVTGNLAPAGASFSIAWQPPTTPQP